MGKKNKVCKPNAKQFNTKVANYSNKNNGDNLVIIYIVD